MHWCEFTALARRVASPFNSMVREWSVTVASGVSRIPFERSSRIRRFPCRCRPSTILRQAMAMRKRKDSPEVLPNAVGIDVGGFSHWVAVPKAAFDEPVREFGDHDGRSERD